MKYKCRNFNFMIELKPNWAFKYRQDLLKTEELGYWISYETSQKNINPFNISCKEYGNIQIQHDIIFSKLKFDDLNLDMFKSARNKANPFEKIKGQFFQNRSALKMCEIDTIFSYLISRPPCNKTYSSKTKREKFKVGKSKGNRWDKKFLSREPVFFADICGGPGGFSEYMFHQLKWTAKGFGITLKGIFEDWRLRSFNNSSPYETFLTFYGEDDSGDITKTKNIKKFIKIVKKSICGFGIDIVMADGGFDSSKDYKSQELLSKQIIFCQITIALSILRLGGIFLIKLFDCYLPHTSSFLYLIGNYFNNFSISKPNQSRPANSERYCIYSNLKKWKSNHSKKGFLDRLLDLNNKINELKETDEMFTPLIPFEKIDYFFKKYLRSFNENNAYRQLVFLKRLKRYIENHSIVLDNQKNIYSQCLKFWFKYKENNSTFIQETNYADRFTSTIKLRSYNSFNVKHIKEILTNDKSEKLSQNYISLLNILGIEINSRRLHYGPVTKKEFSKNGIFSRYPHKYWYIVPLISNEVKRVVLIITAKRNLIEIPYDFSKNKYENKTLMKATNLNLKKNKRISKLPKHSMLDCLKVRILEKGIETNQYKCIDAWVLGSKSIWKRPWHVRAELCRIFCMNIFSNEKRNLKYAYPQPCSLALQKMNRENKKQWIWFIKVSSVNIKGQEDQLNTGRPMKSRVWRSTYFPLEELINRLNIFK